MTQAHPFSRLTHLFLLAGSLTLLLAATFSLAQAAPRFQDAANGEAIFKAKCAACHTVGGGKLVGPDLQGVTTRRDAAWLRRWLKEPDRVLAEGDAIAAQLFEEYNQIPMPNLGLSDSEVAALIAYFESVDTASIPAPSAAPLVPLPPGDAGRGRALFMGTAPFSNGGPHCIACHSVAGIGALGGGALGPDLTEVFNRYGGQAGLAAFLAAPATTTMNAVWSKRPLSEQERADLVAFFETTTIPVRPAPVLWTLAGLSGAGALVLILAAQVWWRQRLASVRGSMLARARAQGNPSRAPNPPRPSER